MEVTFVKLPLSTIPFIDIPSLEHINYKWIDCSYFSIYEFYRIQPSLLSVYDSFDSNNEDFETKDLLFGSVLSEPPPNRGKEKAIKTKVVHQNLNKEDLPHLKYSPNGDSNDNWFYTKDGNYFILSAIKSTYEQVKHLEGITMYGDITLRIRVVIELLKRNIRDGVISSSDVDFNKIAFDIFRAEPSAKKMDDEDIRFGVDNWLQSILSTPLFDEIPKEYRGRVRD